MHPAAGSNQRADHPPAASVARANPIVAAGTTAGAGTESYLRTRGRPRPIRCRCHYCQLLDCVRRKLLHHLPDSHCRHLPAHWACLLSKPGRHPRCSSCKTGGGWSRRRLPAAAAVPMSLVQPGRHGRQIHRRSSCCSSYQGSRRAPSATQRSKPGRARVAPPGPGLLSVCRWTSPAKLPAAVARLDKPAQPSRPSAQRHASSDWPHPRRVTAAHRVMVSEGGWKQ